MSAECRRISPDHVGPACGCTPPACALVPADEIDPVEVHHEEVDVTGLELRILHLEARLKFWQETARARARTVALQMNDLSYLRQRVRDLQTEVEDLTPPRPY